MTFTNKETKAQRNQLRLSWSQVVKVHTVFINSIHKDDEERDQWNWYLEL